MDKELSSIIFPNSTDRYIVKDPNAVHGLESVIQVGTPDNDNTPTEALKPGGIFFKMHGYISGMGKIYGVDQVGRKDPLNLPRTDSAVGMSYSIENNECVSDFDNAYPWAYMKEVVDNKGNVFIEIPKFYHKYTVNTDGTYKIQISGTKHDSSWATLFLSNDGLTEIPYVRIGKYLTSGTKELPTSKKGLQPFTSQRYNDFTGKFNKNYFAYNVFMHQILRILILVEFATTDVQSLMPGATQLDICGKTDSISAVTGFLNELNGGTMKYRGIENTWLNIPGDRFMVCPGLKCSVDSGYYTLCTNYKQMHISSAYTTTGIKVTFPTSAHLGIISKCKEYSNILIPSELIKNSQARDNYIDLWYTNKTLGDLYSAIGYSQLRSGIFSLTFFDTILGYSSQRYFGRMCYAEIE